MSKVVHHEERVLTPRHRGHHGAYLGRALHLALDRLLLIDVQDSDMEHGAPHFGCRVASSKGEVTTAAHRASTGPAQHSTSQVLVLVVHAAIAQLHHASVQQLDTLRLDERARKAVHDDAIPGAEHRQVQGRVWLVRGRATEQAHGHAQSRTHTHSHTATQPHTNTHTHTYTHTHTQPYTHTHVRTRQWCVAVTAAMHVGLTSSVHTGQYHAAAGTTARGGFRQWVWYTRLHVSQQMTWPPVSQTSHTSLCSSSSD